MGDRKPMSRYFVRRKPELLLRDGSVSAMLARAPVRLRFLHRTDLSLADSRSGHWSATYFSLASRTTQARDTFLEAAIRSSSEYSWEGKLTDARVLLAVRSSAIGIISTPVEKDAPSYTKVVHI